MEANRPMEPDGKKYRIGRAPRSVIEYHDWGRGNSLVETVECVFCGADLREKKLSRHLLVCEQADREVRY